MPRIMKFDNEKGQVKPIVCAECSHRTDHEVLSNIELIEEDQYGTSYWEFYEILECEGCHNIAFRKASGNEDDRDPDGNYSESEEIYPSRIANRKKLECHSWMPEALPELISPVYQETYQALCNRQGILCAAGLRILLERICEDLKTHGDNLEAKINNLKQDGRCSTVDAKLLHGTRLFGNEVIHKITPRWDELESAFDVLEHLLNATYVLQAKTALLNKRVEESQQRKDQNNKTTPAL